jgi:hypothetical protein
LKAEALKANLATISNLSYFPLNPAQESIDHFTSFVSPSASRNNRGRSSFDVRLWNKSGTPSNL